MKPRVAFIIQRYGDGVAGGAEAVARTLANRMADGPWDVDVLTTCALDYMTWQDYFPAGVSIDGRVTVRRFPVPNVRDPESFGRWCGRIEHTAEKVPEAEAESWMRAQGPDCPDLVQWVTDHGREYAAVICFTYLYACSYDALRAAPVGRRVLVPFAHDEWPLRLPIWDKHMILADRIVYSADEEQELLESRFSAIRGRGAVLGQGFDPVPVGNADRFRQFRGIFRDFLLYIGRIDRNKGFPEILDLHARLRMEDPYAPDLVLIGKDVMGIGERPGVHKLGFVSEMEKADALAACRALVNPSALESLSLSLLEAWAAERPTICHGNCPVMVGQSRRSGGGLWYHDYYELRAAWDLIRQTPPDAVAAGRWARERYAWNGIVRRYAELVEALNSSGAD